MDKTIFSQLHPEAQRIFRAAFNAAYKDTNSVDASIQYGVNKIKAEGFEMPSDAEASNYLV